MKSLFQKAVLSDARGQYLDAIRKYEAAIADDGETDVEIFINLSFLYWHLATEPSFAGSVMAALPVEDRSALTRKASARWPELLELGLRFHPKNIELLFWQKYFLHRAYFADFTQDDCEELVRRSEEKSLIPYFYMWLFNRPAFERQRKELLQVAAAMPTAKNKYIESVLNTNAASKRCQS